GPVDLTRLSYSQISADFSSVNPASRMMCVMAAVMEGPLADLSAWQAVDCSIAKAMDLVGTRSAVLILREAYYGTRRFDGFAARVGITPAAASAQLRKLTEAGLLEK